MEETIEIITKAGYGKQLNEGAYSEELTKIKKRLRIGLEAYIKLADKSGNENAKQNVGLANTLKDALDGLVDWKAFLNRLHNISLQCLREVEEVEVSKDVEGTFSTTTTIKTKDIPVKKVNDFPDLLASTVRNALAIYNGVLETHKDTALEDVLKFNKAAVDAEKKLAKQKKKKDELKEKIKELEAKVRTLELKDVSQSKELEGNEKLISSKDKHIKSIDKTNELMQSMAIVVRGVNETKELLQLDNKPAKLSTYNRKVVGQDQVNSKIDFAKKIIDQRLLSQARLDTVKKLAKFHLTETKQDGSKMVQNYQDAVVELVSTQVLINDVLSKFNIDLAVPEGEDEIANDVARVLKYVAGLLEHQCDNKSLAKIVQAKHDELKIDNKM